MFRRVLAFLLLAAAPALAQTASAPASQSTTHPAAQVTDTLKDITGAHARVVWMQARERGDLYAPAYTLMGYDTDDGKAERIICGKLGNYFKPLLTPDGQKVLYTDGTSMSVHAIDFDGKNDRILGPGLCFQLWRDPKTAKDYAFIQRGEKSGPREVFQDNPVYKVSLEDPKQATLVWDKTPVTFDNFQVSRDGTRATLEGPWPRCLMAQLPNGEWDVYGRGCYSGLAPDNSYVASHLDGMHRNLLFFAADGVLLAKVPANDIPGFKGRKIHQPRWSNHPRFFTMSGPQPDGGIGSPADVEMYVGRLARDLTRIEAWARVSHNDKLEYYPDLWIAGGEKATLEGFAQSPKPQATTPAAVTGKWPGTAEGIALLWDNALSANRFKDPLTGKDADTMLEPKHNAVFGRFRDMDTTGGCFEVKGDNAALVKAIQATRQFSLEMVITPEQVKRRRGLTVAQLDGGKDLGDFCLSQSGDQLSAFVASRLGRSGRRGGDFHSAGTLVPGKPNHVVITADAETIACYLNAKRGMVDHDARVDFGAWTPGTLRLGAAPDASRNFLGRIEAVAIYNRVLSPAEVAAHESLVRARVKDRAPTARLVVEATLAEVTPTPKPTELTGLYRRALVVHRYKVTKVVSGKDPGKTITVAHWAVLDGKVLKTIGEKKVGQSYTLSLEPIEEHPELVAERTIVNLDPAEAADFYDPTRDGPPVPEDKRSEVEKFRDAIIHGEIDEVGDLLDANAALAQADLPLNGTDDKGKPRTARAIEVAADASMVWNRWSTPIVQMLLERGATIDLPTACRAGLLDTVKARLAKAPDLLEKRDARGRTPLQRAVLYDGYSRDAETVADFLIGRGAKVDIFVAACHVDAARVGELLKADPSLAKATDPEGNTALHWAVRPKRRGKDAPAVMKLLLEAGADPAAPLASADGMTALHLCAAWGGSPEQVDLLLKAGVDINLKDKKGWTPLDHARESHEDQMVKYLRDKGGKEGARGNKRDW